MIRYTLSRLLALVPVLLGVSLLAFLLANLAPGDPAELALSQGDQEPTEAEIAAKREELGLNDPLLCVTLARSVTRWAKWSGVFAEQLRNSCSISLRYARWLGRVVRGDLGLTYIDRVPVLPELARHIPATVQLATAALLLALVLGVSIGTVTAVYRGTLLDEAGRVLALLCASLPSFAVALILIYAFAVALRLVPVAGYGDGHPRYLILPAISLSVFTMGALVRLTRASVLEVLGQDYIRTAYAKGLSKPMVVLKHALRNALLPVVTVAGTQFGQLLGGAAIVETIFAWPGVGRLVVESIYSRDYPIIQGFVLLAGLTFVLVNLATDLLYAVIDPRIRLGAGAQGGGDDRA